jgi:hypothetical protein
LRGWYNWRQPINVGGRSEYNPVALNTIQQADIGDESPGRTSKAGMRAFTAKRRFANLLSAVPVHVVMVNAALLGAAIYGLQQAARN